MKMIPRFAMLKLNKAQFVAVVLAFVLVLCAFAIRVSYYNFALSDSLGRVESISLPLSRESVGGPAEFVVSGQMILAPWAPKTFRIIPDDRVTQIFVNDKAVSLSGFAPEELSSWGSGFLIDLSPFLQSGENTLRIHFSDIGEPGLMGMAIQNPGVYWRWLFVLAGVLLLSSIALGALSKRGISRLRTFLYVLIGVGGLVRVLCIFIYNPVNHIGSDAQRHWESGIDVLRIDLMTMTDPIMYQLYISVLAKLSLQLPILVAFYTSLLSLITPWIWYRFFRELSPNKTIALGGWAFLALLPSWISIYSYFMQETLMLPLLGAALWSTWRARRKKTTSAFILMVGLWILVGLTRGIAIPLAAVCCVWLWIAQDNKLKKATYSTILLLLIMGPLTYRSYQTVHHFAPHGMGHLAAIYGMSGKREILLHTEREDARWSHIFGSPSTGAEPFAPFSDWRTQRAGQIVVSVDLDKGKEDWSKAYESVALSWDDFLWITKENLIFLFFASSWPDNNTSRVVDAVNVGMRWVWVPATIAAVTILIFSRRRLQRDWLLPTLLLVWFLVQGLMPISVNEGRYRKPFEGMLVAQYLLLLSIRRRPIMAAKTESAR